MNRIDYASNRQNIGVPRMRGDEPPPYAQVPMTNERSPHARG